VAIVFQAVVQGLVGRPTMQENWLAHENLVGILRVVRLRMMERAYSPFSFSF
jgi:hypothetical protein